METKVLCKLVKTSFGFVELLSILFVCASCLSDISDSICATVLVQPGLNYPTMFNIKENGVIDIATYNIPIFDYPTIDYADNIVTKQSIQLLDNDKLAVYDLICELSSLHSNSHKKVVSDGASEIYAIVNDKLYWSRYSIDYTQNLNDTKLCKELLELTYKLIELSQIDVGVDGPSMPTYKQVQ